MFHNLNSSLRLMATKQYHSHNLCLWCQLEFRTGDVLLAFKGAGRRLVKEDSLGEVKFNLTGAQAVAQHPNITVYFHNVFENTYHIQPKQRGEASCVHSECNTYIGNSHETRSFAFAPTSTEIKRRYDDMLGPLEILIQTWHTATRGETVPILPPELYAMIAKETISRCAIAEQLLDIPEPLEPLESEVDLTGSKRVVILHARICGKYYIQRLVNVERCRDHGPGCKCQDHRPGCKCKRGCLELVMPKATAKELFLIEDHIGIRQIYLSRPKYKRVYSMASSERWRQVFLPTRPNTAVKMTSDVRQ